MEQNCFILQDVDLPNSEWREISACYISCYQYFFCNT